MVSVEIWGKRDGWDVKFERSMEVRGDKGDVGF